MLKINVARIGDEVRLIFTTTFANRKPGTPAPSVVEFDHEIQLTKDQAKYLMDELGGTLEKMKQYDPKNWNDIDVKPPTNKKYVVSFGNHTEFSVWLRENDGWVTPCDVKVKDGDPKLLGVKYRSFDSFV